MSKELNEAEELLSKGEIEEALKFIMIFETKLWRYFNAGALKY